jgi:ubiquinone/menaquinone biosynthesis C-methylase UbiE
MKDHHHHVCSPSYVKLFDNFLRPLVHKPAKLFGPYVRKGMTVLDVGCGAGWATIGLARLVGPEGRVIAADLQPAMLNMTRNRAAKLGLSRRIIRHKTEPDRIGTEYRLDFANAFWMVHELPDQAAFLAEIFNLLEPGGHLFIAEPKGHVTAADLESTIILAQKTGYKITAHPKPFMSRAVILQKP